MQKHKYKLINQLRAIIKSMQANVCKYMIY